MSKGLVALYDISSFHKWLKETTRFRMINFDERASVVEKELNALEIIKEKGIILQFIKETYSVEAYNMGVFGTLVKPLTQEEYDLLKEVLL